MGKIPKQVFLLWDKPRAEWPEIVELCIPLWQALNPDWDITVFDGPAMQAQLEQDLPREVLAPMAIQTKSDLLRLKLLSERGGIWADATCLPLAPLRKWFHLVEQDDFAAPGFGHLIDGGAVSPRGRDYGNWFLLSQPGGYVTSRLYQRMLAYHHKPRFPIPQSGPVQDHLNTSWRLFLGPHAEALSLCPYFLMHYLTAIEIENDPTFREICASNSLPKGVYNYVMSRMANLRNSDERYQEVLDYVSRAPTPCNKLDWKLPSQKPWDEVRDIILDKTPQRRAQRAKARRAAKARDAQAQDAQAQNTQPTPAGSGAQQT